MARRIRVAVIDPHPMFRRGIVQVIRKAGRFTIVGEGRTSEDVPAIVREKKPDVLLFDIAVQSNAIEIVEAIARDEPNVKVIILTALDDEEHVMQAINAGASGYLLKDVSRSELIRTIEAIYGGEHYVCPDLAWRLLTELGTGPAKAPPAPAQVPNLTVREQQVLGHSSQGLTNQEIAVALGVSLRTVKYYKTQLFGKLRARNRIEAVLLAKKMKMV